MKTNLEFDTVLNVVCHLKNLRRMYNEKYAELSANNMPTAFWEAQIRNIDKTLKEIGAE